MDPLKQSLLRAQAFADPAAPATPAAPRPQAASKAVQPASAPRPAAAAAGSALERIDARFSALDRKLDSLIGMLREPSEKQCATNYLLIADVRRALARFFGVSEQDIDRAGRTARIARIRQIGFFLCRTHTTRSLPEIGKSFGDRDHSTVLHGIRKIEALRRVDAGLDADLAKLEARLDALRQRRRQASAPEA
ncbi:MAG: hypothetical protein IT536_13925 [Hyphomicrobiales bacterium]|nr:hypothetical protein [Hyphomicrobiales bacterium]